jgi:hypothetical protein
MRGPWKHPPQGTSQIVDHEKEARYVESASQRMVYQMRAAQHCPGIKELQHALWEKDVQKVKELIPPLKKEYGKYLYFLVKGILPPELRATPSSKPRLTIVR